MDAVLVFFQILLQCFDQRFVDVFSTALPSDEGGQILAKPLYACGMESGLGFAHRQDQHLVYIFGAALGVGIKIAHGVQIVPKKFCPKGSVGGRGEYIQNATPNRELTGALYHIAAAVACAGELGQKFVQFVFAAGFQRESGAAQHFFGHGPLAQGVP